MKSLTDPQVHFYKTGWHIIFILYNGIYSLGKAKDLVEATRQGEIGNQDSIIRRWARYKLINSDHDVEG